MLTQEEISVLRKFRQFLMAPGQMLCFFGPDLKKHQKALEELAAKDFLVEEEFDGGYSLTNAGFEAMKTCVR